MSAAITDNSEILIKISNWLIYWENTNKFYPLHKEMFANISSLYWFIFVW